MTDTLWWLLVVLMLGAGLLGTVLPALPGTALILAGIVLGAWIDGFARVGALTLVLVVALAVLSWVLEAVASLLGARKAGASRWALLGATLGTVVGLLMGLVGVLFMPLVGAALGELWARNRLRRGAVVPRAEAGAATVAPGQGLQQDFRQALHVGLFAWLGLLAGLLAKVVLGCTMVGVFVVALAF